jgi:TPR repeat protein
MDYLELSVGVGFVPALMAFVRLCLGQSTAHQHGIEMLRVAANRYHNVEATARLAYFMSLEGDEEGFATLERAAAAGCAVAHCLLGKLLSPACPDRWSPKNGAKAMEHLQRCAEIHANCLASCEMARLLWVGCDGVPQDRERAKELYSQAEELAQGAELPPLEGESGGTTWLVAGAVFAAVAAFGRALFWHLRRRG